MRVAVTGASGFIGSHVVKALVNAGHTPIAFSRSADKLARAARIHGTEHVRQMVGDVTDPVAVRRLLALVDAVVHTAGIASTKGTDLDQLMHVNVGGTRTVLDQAVGLALDPIVHVSSVAALFPSPGPVMASDDPLSTFDSGYAQSKAAAEAVAREAQTAGHPVVTVYPGGVFGPDDPGTSDIIDGNVLMLDKEAFMLPTGGGNSFVDVRDLSRAIMRMIRPGLGPRRYMAGGTWADWEDWVGWFERFAGRDIRIISLPRRAMLALGSLLDTIGRVSSKTPPLSREAVSFMSLATPTDDTAIETDLGVTWRPLDESVSDFVDWLIDDRRIDAVKLGLGDRIAARVVTSDRFRSFGRRNIPTWHRRMARLTGGRFVPGARLMLTTIGARTGAVRQTPLETVPMADGSFLIVGSNWAGANHPAWTFNLLSNPHVEVVHKGRRITVRAQLLEGDDRRRAWRIALEHWPAWQEYTALTERTFRIFRLEPV